ncbi:MAG: hypothetical protein P8J66_03245 [Verrucomicrobiota bacterium]|nr:hypothetical protein [Verrucomicrobiota bacterium]
MLAFLDNGFFLFLVIALLSAVSDWISKRRAAKKEDDSLSVPPITTGRATGAPEPALGDSPQRKLPKIFAHLEQELKRLAKDSPVVEVLEEPAVRRENSPESFEEQDREIFGEQHREIFGDQHRETFGEPDPLAAQKKKLADAERIKKEAGTKLANAKKAARRKKTALSQKTTHALPQTGISPRKLRRWVRNAPQLRTAIALNTILETPKGLQHASQKNPDRGF